MKTTHTDSVNARHALLGPYKSTIVEPVPPPQRQDLQTLIDVVNSISTKDIDVKTRIWRRAWKKSWIVHSKDMEWSNLWNFFSHKTQANSRISWLLQQEDKGGEGYSYGPIFGYQQPAPTTWRCTLHLSQDEAAWPGDGQEPCHGRYFQIARGTVWTPWVKKWF